MKQYIGKTSENGRQTDSGFQTYDRKLSATALRFPLLTIPKQVGIKLYAVHYLRVARARLSNFEIAGGGNLTFGRRAENE